MQKKPLILVGLVLVILVGGGVFVGSKLLKKPAATPTQTQKKKITDPVNVIDQKERPYLQISPVDDKNIKITVNEIKKEANSMEYELEYQTDSSLQGLTGVLDLASLPAQTKSILLGTCSAGGACTYHKNVQGGTMLVKLSGGAASYALKQDWKYVDNAKKESAISSRDAFFQMESKDLANQRFLIIYNTPGYPKNPAGTVISEAYSLTGVNPLSGKAMLTMRAKEDAAGAVIAGWNGQSWQEFKGQIDGKSITAEVSLLPVYVVIKK